mgnify:CR=1 FL=1
MKRALSLVDERAIDAVEYGAKDPQWQAQRRRQLACIGCGGPATFRSGTRRMSSFAAQHREDCLLSAKTWSAFRYLQ